MNSVNFSNLVINRQKELGSGYIAKVYEAQDKSNGRKYAVKIVISDAEKKALRREIEFQQSVNHPYIVRLYAHFERNQQLFIVLEYVENGTLFKIMRKNFLTEKQIVKYFKQILEAVKIIHDRNTIHRDIKPENILLSKNNNAKLCDFGFCAPINNNEDRRTMCGTREYLAPEIAAKYKQNEKVDVWCLGILLYEMTHKKVPFESHQVFLMAHEKRRPKISFKPTLHKDFKFIIDSCLQINPNKRPSVKQILDMPIFQQKDSFSKYKKKAPSNRNQNFFNEQQPNINRFNPNVNPSQFSQQQVPIQQTNKKYFNPQSQKRVNKTRIRRANSTINQRSQNNFIRPFSPIQQIQLSQQQQSLQNNLIQQPVHLKQMQSVHNVQQFMYQGSKRSYTPNINESIKRAKYSLTMKPQTNPLYQNIQKPVQFVNQQGTTTSYIQIIKK